LLRRHSLIQLPRVRQNLFGSGLSGLGFRDYETHENNETDEKEPFAENSSGEMRLVVFGESLDRNISSLTT
jgi:hypothetical protein